MLGLLAIKPAADSAAGEIAMEWRTARRVRIVLRQIGVGQLDVRTVVERARVNSAGLEVGAKPPVVG